MQSVSIEDLTEDKVLPYNLYDASGEKLFEAGEVLTSGKLLQIKNLPEVFTDDSATEGETASEPDIDKLKKNIEENQEEEDSQHGDTSAADDFDPDFSMRESDFVIDTVDITKFKGPLNITSKIDPELQLRLKAFYTCLLNLIGTKKPSDIHQMYMDLKEKIIFDIIMKLDKVHYFSELRLMGNYHKCHALNVAILSGTLATKMGLRESLISDIILGALVHDIGKTKIPASFLDLTTPTDKEQKILQTHTKIGYKILKEDLGFAENIAKIALEHHENNNGSGYPYGKSGDFIEQESRIIAVCNHFDNLVSNKTPQKIINCHEACRIMLELGTGRFSSNVLYTFVHMLGYNDIVPLEEMVI